ncbi:S-adenosylmethionine-dependent methyltransferase Rv2258c-like isoform X1 [Haliotis cracherodii]|uniref:S-adenosylmethionine-dependent methyltransferase Rv2258c-like isoform X1 n=1 Tax=Haliotis cracherodii TaxID=6455 RepID=UPI0039ED71E0
MDTTEYGRMVDGYTASGAVASAIALAKDLGILDILYECEEPLTSQNIADKGGLKERYVRELVSALVTGGVIQVDSTSTLFHINAEFKPVLREKSIFTRMVPYFGEKYGAIMNCCTKDGPAGVRYSEHPVLFDMMDEMRAETQDRLLDRDVLPVVPALPERLKSGIDVAEIGCASGTLILNLCARFPASRFTGSDVVESVLDIARNRASDRGISNSQFMTINVCHIPDSPKKHYDWIFLRDVVHDLPNPEGCLSGIYKMLRPGGYFSMLDFGLQGSLSDNVGNVGISYMYASSTFICIPESYQEQKSAALGPCFGVQKARALLLQAGFILVQEHHSAWNEGEVHFVCQRPE